jgi:hypothetical protein
MPIVTGMPDIVASPLIVLLMNEYPATRALNGFIMDLIICRNKILK